MANDSYGNLTLNGLWKNNIGLVQLLGLCPLLAVSSTVVNALGLGLATTLVLLASNASVSLIRNLVRPEIRIPAFMMIIASFVTAIDLAMQGWLFELHKILGIFIPLIVTNCAILGRAEAFASRTTVDRAAIDGFMMGIGFTIVLLLLGGMREILGQGTLFSNAHLMFGEAARGWTITLIGDYRGFLLAILPPGAFIGLGLLIAVKNIIDERLSRPVASVSVGEVIEQN
ncbi:electron transport complex subunit E [Sulfuriflexus sp.]|uniref:electron transport complex subunit E n=1 Tax=Sulfuriflexus sp. TaxID=2015443 RepID=UPI0028CFA2C5|nr:electron transport complex subunit E [Sulfuriflexus sp.]MDT8404660.1 electron transport complex subunit E [Sulfuriflexus sp.]